MKKLFAILLSLVVLGTCVGLCACKDDPTDPPQGTDKEFEGLNLTSATVNYDGQKHSLKVSGTLPQGATVAYTYDMQGVDGDEAEVDGVVDVGTYTVKAIVSCTGYKTLNLTASLTIKGQKFAENITLSGSSYRNYTGHKQSLEVTGTLPEGTKVTYTYDGVECDGVIAVGEYVVRATLSKAGYETKIITRTLEILALQFPEMKLQSQTVAFDGAAHSLAAVDPATGNVIATVGGEDSDASILPGNASINVTYNDEQVFSATEAGTYNVKWVITCEGYETKILTGTLTITAE